MGLIPGVVVWGGVIVIGAELAGRGYSGKNLLASMYALIACLVGMLVGQAWGGLGIAVGVSFGYLIGFVASMSYFHFLVK